MRRIYIKYSLNYGSTPKVQGDSYGTRLIYLAVFQAEQSDITPYDGSDCAPPGTTRRATACVGGMSHGANRRVSLKVLLFDGSHNLWASFYMNHPVLKVRCKTIV